MDDEVTQTRSSGESGESAQDADGRMKRLTIDIPEHLHRAVKLRTVAEGTTMAAFLRRLLAAEVAANKDTQ